MKSPQQNISLGLNHSTLHGCGALLGAVMGASFGSLCGFILPEPYYQLTNPQILNDGQWGMIYFKAIPEGLLIGSIIGLVAGLIVSNKINRRFAGSKNT